MFKINPYRPGAGLMPIYLAGRDDDIENIDSLFMAMTYNIPVQFVIFSGLRGVGKTVLINSLQKKAEEKNIFCKHIAMAFSIAALAAEGNTEIQDGQCVDVSYPSFFTELHPLSL